MKVFTFVCIIAHMHLITHFFLLKWGKEVRDAQPPKNIEK